MKPIKYVLRIYPIGFYKMINWRSMAFKRLDISSPHSIDALGQDIERAEIRHMYKVEH